MKPSEKFSVLCDRNKLFKAKWKTARFSQTERKKERKKERYGSSLILLKNSVANAAINADYIGIATQTDILFYGFCMIFYGDSATQQSRGS